MALVKRPGSPFWWIRLSVPKELRVRVGTSRIQQSTGTTDKVLAQELHAKVQAGMWRQDKLGELPDATLRQAVDRWKLHAKTHKLRNVADVLSMLEWWCDKLGEHRPLSRITRRDIMAAVEGKMTIPKSSTEKPRPASPARINRYLAAIRRVLKLAAGPWEMIESCPEITLLPEPKGRVRAADKEELKKMVAELPQHYRPPFLLALSTGLRKGNVVPLEWPQVDLERRRLLVDADDFKTGKDFGIPLNDTAMAILQAQKGKHDTAVFTQADGKPLKDIKHRTWSAALKRAGVENFRWHDLRHTWATMLVEAGEDLDRIQKLGGWESREMVERYAHFRTEHLRGSSQKVDKFISDLL